MGGLAEVDTLIWPERSDLVAVKAGTGLICAMERRRCERIQREGYFRKISEYSHT
jgi:hypothetical protein